MTKPSANQSGDRLNKFLAGCGLGSRRGCEELITGGHVEVNGEPCLELATRIQPGDSVRVDGRLLREAEPATVLLNKPRGYLCTRHDPGGRPTIFDLLPAIYKTLHSVGRLDLESSGLLLLTNRGDLTEHLTHPRHEVEKEYHVTLNRVFERERVDRLLAGIHLDEGLAKAHSVRILSRKRLAIVLRQGYNRQIRRMFAALDYQVKQLERIRIGGLTAPILSTGEWKVIGRRDIAKVLG